VGIFGFPIGQLAAENGAVNLGLRDAMLGLEWLKNHIWAFGGDPEHITIYGESAGGSLISLLYLQPDVKLFRNAIIESGGQSIVPVGHTETVWPDAYNLWLRTMWAVQSVRAKTTSFNCMRAVSNRLLSDGQNYLMALPRYSNI
jgi:carboxylesterase type B